MSTTSSASDYTGQNGMQSFEFPSRVRIHEVGPRDGFQLESELIPTADKIKIIDALSRSGVPAIQLTSFVRPDAVPQLSDGGEVVAGHRPADGVDYSVLVPNRKGAERALAFGVDTWELMLSVSDAHSRANANCSTIESFERIGPAIALGLEHGVNLVGGMGTALGCPFEGRTSYDRLTWAVDLYAAAGVSTVNLADTAGLADPAYVLDVCTRLRADFPSMTFSLHLHNTRGLGLANVMAGLAAGIEAFDSSIGGLGGCPYAPGATGNIATEELVHLLELLGVETGIDLDTLIAIARGPVRRAVGHRLESSFERADPAWVLHTPPDRQVLAEQAARSRKPVSGTSQLHPDDRGD